MKEGEGGDGGPFTYCKSEPTRHRKGTQPNIHKSEGNLAATDPPTKLFGFTVLGIELFTDVAWTLLGALLVNEL